MKKLTSSTALTEATVAPKTPPLIGNHFLRFSTSTSLVAIAISPLCLGLDRVEAAHQMTRRDLNNLRLFLSALLRDKWAARVETATLGHMVWGGDHALDGGQWFIGLLLREFRNGRQQTVRVRVTRRLEDLFGRRVLDNLAGIRDGDGLCHFSDDGEVVGNDENGHTRFRQQAAHQVQNLRLDGDIERRRGFIRDQELRVRGQCHGYHDPLTHTAAHLMGVLAEAPFGLGDTYQVKHLDSTLLRLGVIDLLMQSNGFANLIPNRVDRIERRHGFLEDHGDFVTTYHAHLFFILLEKVFPMEEDLASDDLTRRVGNKAHDREGCNGFSATRLAHQAYNLSPVNSQINAIHGRNNTVLRVEERAQVLDINKYFSVVHGTPPYSFSFGSMASRSPSPKKLNPRTVIKIESPGKMMRRGEFQMNCWAF